LIQKPIKDGEIRIISVSSDEDDSDIDIDPNTNIKDKFGLYPDAFPPNILNNASNVRLTWDISIIILAIY
jgi:hypothetical protein